MKQEAMTCSVIAICGSASGAGKSTLTIKLGEVIPNAVTMFFDAYHETTVYPPNIYKDLAEGKDIHIEEIKNDKFYYDLQQLIHGNEIVDPWNRVLKPSKYVILEEPFAKLRTGMREIIDFTVCIDLPMEISLARRLLRNMRSDFNHLSVEERFQYIESFLEEYLHGGRISYIKLFEAVSSDCDLIVDGQLSMDAMVNEVMMKLTEVGLLKAEMDGIER